MGGRVDPKTGDIVWEAHVPLDEQRAFYASHRPRALDGLSARPIELPDHEFDGHGEPVNAIFELQCRCGSRQFIAFGYFKEGEPVRPPLTIECADCDLEHVLFDDTEHGYDAEMGNNREPVDHEGAPDELWWDEFGPPYALIVRFEFPSEHLGDDRYAGKEPNLFSWITVLARDDTGKLMTLLDYECA
jgi:hypothetical protein